MKNDARQFECVVPASVAEALAAKAARPELIPVAGGTEVMVWMNDGKMPARPTMSLHRLAPEWRHITETADGGLRIGALATYTDIRFHAAVAARYAMLVESARQTGALQIQNRGTLVGNVANASPAADSVPVLMAYDARIVAASPRGEREIPITEFYKGYRQTACEPDEMIAAIVLPPRHATWRDHYRKVGTREAQAISKVVFAGSHDSATGAWRLAFGSVGPTTIRAVATEQAIAAGATPEEAGRVLLSEIRPIDDIRSTGAYRRAVAVRILREFLAEHS
jgi:CO/xanthine dehydrogenase FAD-binding subunit